MNAQMRWFCVAWMVLVCLPGLAQTPTPLPGTPQALTCMDFTHLPGMSGVEVINNWEYLDRACVVLQNNTGGAIEISACQGYFSVTSNPLIMQIRIWEILNESLLPDLPAAAIQVSDTYGFSADPIVGSPQVALVTFDLEGYMGGTVPMPVINPGKKFVIDFINLLDEGGSGVPGMKITAEQVGDCPPSFWADGTNIYGNYQTGATTWSFKELIGLSTNFYIGVTYYDNADPRTPAMGTLGLFGVLGAISLVMMRKRK